MLVRFACDFRTDLHFANVDKHTSFNFIKIPLMLHHEVSTLHFGYIVTDSAKMQEIKHLKL